MATDADLIALRFALKPYSLMTPEQLRDHFIYHSGLETAVRDVVALIVAARAVVTT